MPHPLHTGVLNSGPSETWLFQSWGVVVVMMVVVIAGAVVLQMVKSWRQEMTCPK